jgi:hypothetical protein
VALSERTLVEVTRQHSGGNGLTFAVPRPVPELRTLSAPDVTETTMYRTAYRTVDVNGLSIFYREAGPQDAPALLSYPDPKIKIDPAAPLPSSYHPPSA